MSVSRTEFQTKTPFLSTGRYAIALRVSSLPYKFIHYLLFLPNNGLTHFTALAVLIRVESMIYTLIKLTDRIKCFFLPK